MHKTFVGNLKTTSMVRGHPENSTHFHPFWQEEAREGAGKVGGKDDGTTKFGTCVGGISTTPHISQGPGAHHHQLHNIHHLNDKPSLPILISAPRVCGVPGGPESSCGVQETCEEKRKPNKEEGRRKKRRG